MMNRQMNSSNPISGVHCASHKGNADALILSVMVMIAPLALIAVSILVPVHMLLRNFLSGIQCTVSSLAVTASIVAIIYAVFRRGSPDGQ